MVEFNILEFYRGRHTYVGIDTLALSSVETADVLRELAPGFAGDHVDAGLMGEGGLVDALGGQRVVSIRNGHDAGHAGNTFAAQSVRVACSVPALVMTPDNG